MNLLTLVATLGVLVALFQWGLGRAATLLRLVGRAAPPTPVLLFVFIFGLSMDYEVFLLARIKEEVRPAPPDTDRAVPARHHPLGPGSSLAAVCIGIVFLGFAAGGLVAVKEIGVGMTVAIVIDVTVVRGTAAAGADGDARQVKLVGAGPLRAARAAGAARGLSGAARGRLRLASASGISRWPSSRTSPATCRSCGGASAWGTSPGPGRRRGAVRSRWSDTAAPTAPA